MVGDRLCSQEPPAVEDDAELVAADATDRGTFDLGDRLEQRVGSGTEDLVARSVAVGVVHDLELVDVAHDQPTVDAVHRRTSEDLAQLGVENPAVPEPGQGIAERVALVLLDRRCLLDAGGELRRCHAQGREFGVGELGFLGARRRPEDPAGPVDRGMGRDLTRELAPREVVDDRPVVVAQGDEVAVPGDECGEARERHERIGLVVGAATFAAAEVSDVEQDLQVCAVVGEATDRHTRRPHRSAGLLCDELDEFVAVHRGVECGADGLEGEVGLRRTVALGEIRKGQQCVGDRGVGRGDRCTLEYLERLGREVGVEACASCIGDLAATLAPVRF